MHSIFENPTNKLLTKNHMIRFMATSMLVKSKVVLGNYKHLFYRFHLNNKQRNNYNTVPLRFCFTINTQLNYMDPFVEKACLRIS